MMGKHSRKRACAVAQQQQQSASNANAESVQEDESVAGEQSNLAELSSAKKKRKKNKKKKKESQGPQHGTEAKEKEDNPVDNDDGNTFPFEFEPDDHCESPIEAYEHVACLLKKLGPNEQDLSVYDPYYCDGSVRTNLAQLGFPKVYNKKEDCYPVWQSCRLPSFDVLVTNPPYSADHIEKLIKFVTSPTFGNRPWFLLMPNWVHKKDYFLKATHNIQPFFIVPKKRYVYRPPSGFRESKRSDTHKKSSPFVSMWYIWAGTSAKNQALISAYYKSPWVSSGACDLARSKSALRDLRRKR